MCWGRAWPFKVGAAECPMGPTPASSGGSGTHPPTSRVGTRKMPSWSTTWATSSLACQSSACGIRCAGAWASSGGGEDWGRESKTLTVCPSGAAALRGQGAHGPPVHQHHSHLHLSQQPSRAEGPAHPGAAAPLGHVQVRLCGCWGGAGHSSRLLALVGIRKAPRGLLARLSQWGQSGRCEFFTGCLTPKLTDIQPVCS